MKFRTCITFFSLMSAICAQNTVVRGQGLILPTAEELAHIQGNWSEIEHIHPNKVGSARILSDHAKNGLEALSIAAASNEHQEFKNAALMDPLALPRYVDNSLLPSFPPIGDQGPIGSCLAWASTYYQATHELGLANGWNNKSHRSHILSPKWTYNMINGGVDRGSMITDAYGVLTQNGAVSIATFPYDYDYLSWDLNEDHWVSALSSRLGTPKFIPGLDTGDLTRIKRALNNGHVLTFATFINSWNYTIIGSHPDSDARFAGQLASYAMHGTNGGHMMTIVGYNDDIWVDINGNGELDPGEKGAFLVANSWGCGWGNNGFMWVAYDAFRAVSAVPGISQQGRVPLSAASGNLAILTLPKAPHYKPSLIVQFELSQTSRNEIKVAAGASDHLRRAPTNYFLSGALSYQGGSFNFEGRASQQPIKGTFCLDLTDLIKSNDKYYLILADNATGHPTTLNSLVLRDLANDATIQGINQPKTIDNGKLSVSIPYSFPKNPPKPTPSTPSYISSPTDNQRVSDLTPFVYTASEPLDAVDFYIDGNLIFRDKDAPYCVFVDTIKLSNGLHQFAAVAYKGSERPERSTVNVMIAN